MLAAGLSHPQPRAGFGGTAQARQRRALHGALPFVEVAGVLASEHHIADLLRFVVGDHREVTRARIRVSALARVARPVLGKGQYTAAGAPLRRLMCAGQRGFLLIEKSRCAGLHIFRIQRLRQRAAQLRGQHRSLFVAIASIAFPGRLQMREIAEAGAAGAVLDVPVRPVESDHQLAVVAHPGVVDGVTLPRRQLQTGVEFHIPQHAERQRQQHRIVIALHAASGDIERKPHAAVGEFAYRHQFVSQLHRHRQALGQTGRDAVIAVDHVETIAAGNPVAIAHLRELAASVAMHETQETDRTQFVEARAVSGGVVGRADDPAQQPAAPCRPR